MSYFRLVILVPCAVFVAALLSPASANPAAHKLDFKKDVLPIFKKRCTVCHNSTYPKAGLALDKPEGIEKGKVVVPGKSAESKLYKRITAQDDDRMPPKGDPLTTEQIKTIQDWIDQGAQM